MILRRIKDLFTIPAIVGPEAQRAALPILAFQEKGEEGQQQHWPIRSKLKWTVLTDRSIGGKSEATFTITRDVERGKDGRKEAAAERQARGRRDMAVDRKQGSIAVFSGHLSTLRPSADPTVKRTGYCAVKIEFPRPLLIEQYEGLELRVRTDGRSYVTNLEVSSFFPDELYQGYITGLPKEQWFTLQLPFRDMTLTRLGRYSHMQRDLDSNFTLESIGFLIADGKSGPFRLDIDSVSAISKITGRPLEKALPSEEEREEERNDGGQGQDRRTKR